MLITQLKFISKIEIARYFMGVLTSKEKGRMNFRPFSFDRKEVIKK